ncbi:uncharacterized protein LOC114857874 [Betta splendens]|uniref:Uncharacterized protein LOC114857874 n=1 Tax=Betta splendens TaxID=158456 RepID=A0A6P7MUK3_BETSP|nr:uncharacterized protein LOC114857874 [Betta splendens]
MPLEESSPVRDTRASDGRAAASQEDARRLRADNRRDGGPRGQRTAALHFGGHVAQSDGGAGDAASGGPADERLETQPFVDNSLAAAGGGESAARAPDEPEDSNQQPSADLHNVNQPAVAEGDDHMVHERLSKVEHEAERRNSVTSGAADVKAPPCHQAVARVESEGQRAALANEDMAPTTESCSIAAHENECVAVTLNDSPTEGEDERLSVWSDPADALQHPVEVIHSHHRCTASDDVPGPVYRDAATHPHTGNVLNMESVNVQAPEESLCPQGEAQEDSVTFDLHWQAIAAARAELTEPCAQIQTDLNASTAQTERQKVMTSVGVDEIGVKNNFTTRATSLEAQAETHDAAERGNLESCVFEDEIIHPADSEAGAEVAGSMTKADHTRGDTFVQFKDKPIIVTEHTQHWEMKAAVAAVEESSPAQPADWETTGLVEEKEQNVSTDEEKTETTGSKSEDAEAVGRLEDTAVEKEVEKAQTGEKAEEREAEDADALEDQQNAEGGENRKMMARTDGNAEATQIKTIIGENEPTEGCVTEKRGDKRTNVQNEEETEPEKQTEIELRGEAQAGARREDGVKPEDHTEHNHLDYVGEVLVAEGRGAEADPRGVTSAAAEDGAGRRRGRRAITQNEVAAGSSALLSNTPGEDQGDAGGDASAESDSDDEVELYMRCLRAVHAGPAPGRGDGGRGPSAGRSRSRSTHMPPISEALDEEQPLSCPLCEDAERPRVHKRVSCWKEACSCSSISKALLYASSLVVFLVVAYHYDFLACFALYLASVVWLCCQGDTRTTRG